MTDRIGQQLGNYRLIRLIGQGGFAEVYLGEHIRLHSQAAIKVLNAQLASGEAASFQREAHTIARLLHPNIIRIFDYDIAESIPFLIMDYAPNGTLRHRYPKGSRVPLTDIISYTKQVASALQYAHNEKVIHRDVKPENMLLGRNQEVLISDFGIATMSQSSRLQNTQDIVGTVAYMSPEQIQGRPHTASDQYSLGVVIYEWLTGACPFHGTFTEIAVQHTVATPKPLREIVPGIAPEIEQVIAIALAKNPNQRFGNIQAFANALEQACSPVQFTPSIPPPPPPYFPSSDPGPVVVNYPAVQAYPENYYRNTPPAFQDTNTSKPGSRFTGIPTSTETRNSISRRTALAVLIGTGLTVAGAGIAALLHTQYGNTNTQTGSSASASSTLSGNTPEVSTPTPTPSNPTPTAPPSASWSPLPGLPTPEADNVIAYAHLPQGEYIYMTNGYQGSASTPYSSNTLFRYNINTAQWEIVTTSFPGMLNNACVRDEQNNLFFTAGYSPDAKAVTTLLYKYQPDTGTWQVITPPSTVTFGYANSMIADQKGSLYLTEGFMKVYHSYSSAGTGWFRYNIAQDQWQSLSPLPQGMGYTLLASDGQGGFVLMGGVTDTEQNVAATAIYRYNIASDTWTRESTTIPQAFNGSASCDLGNGKAILIGGYDPVQQTTLSNTWLVDLKSLHFTPLTPLPNGGSRLGTATSDGAGNVYVVRGVSSDPKQPNKDFWRLSVKL